MKKIFLVIVFVVMFSQLHALEMPCVFGDHMVLQRDQELRIWGKGTPGDRISVEFKGKSAAAIVSADGNWQVVLPPFAASAEPAELSVKSSQKTITFTDILLGDVFLCAGQSNMQWYINGITEKKKYISQIDQPLLRVMDIRYAWAKEPRFHHEPSSPKNKPAKWKISNLPNAQEFSAVGFIAGLTIHQKTGVPVGLISVAVGGGRIEAFSAPDSYRKAPGIPDDIRKKFEDSANHFRFAKDEELAKEKQRYPLAIYNGMIAMIMPVNLRAILWYQGEENYRDGFSYEPKLDAFAWSMRTGFCNSKLPIYLVMVPPWEYNSDSTKGDKVPRLWMAQQRWVQRDPYSDLISTTDCGTVNDVHPMSKEPLSLRLADLVLYREYGIGSSDVLTPTARSAKRSGRSVTVEFFNPSPLKTADGKAVTYLELAGKDGVFHPAEGVIQGDKLIVSSAGVAEPRTIRFAFDCIALHNLVNSRNIPVAPFELKIFQ